MFESCFIDPHCGSSVYTRNILSFIPAEDIDQIKLAFTYRGLKHTGGSIRWMQPTSERTFCRCTRLRSRFAENDATDFRMRDEKWCNGLLSLLSAIAAIAFCCHIIEVRIEWESELASESASRWIRWVGLGIFAVRSLNENCVVIIYKNVSHDTGKPVFGVCDQLPAQLQRLAIESWNFGFRNFSYYTI